LVNAKAGVRLTRVHGSWDYKIPRTTTKTRERKREREREEREKERRERERRERERRETLKNLLGKSEDIKCHNN